MRIAIIGGTGTIGQILLKELSTRHELIVIGRSRGMLQVDISDAESIKAMYKKLGKIDAVVSAVGKVHFGPLKDFTEKEYAIGLNHKLMGQVNLVLMGIDHMQDEGSFTLTSGILNRDPIVLGSSAAMVNGAIDGFVRSAAIEMPQGIRINAVSPTVLQESMSKYADYFRGFVPVSSLKVAKAYVKSIEGRQTGQVYFVD